MASKNYFDGVLIKRPHTIQRWTENDIQDLLKCQDLDTGPDYFLENFFYIQHPLRGKLRYHAYDYQQKLLENYHKNRFSANLLGRQLGKCFEKSINICIMNKYTGKIYDIPVGKLYEYEKAKRDGHTLPDISQYERKTL
jgi:hypothetical protein